MQGQGGQGVAAVGAAISGLGYAAEPQKGTAVDSINANIDSVATRINTLTQQVQRITDGLIGAAPPADGNASGGPRPVVLSTQEHIRALETAFERLSQQVNRLL